MKPLHAITVTKQVAAPVAAVWEVLSDGWAYATWVVGASRVRAVDEGWPGRGSRLHHSFGLWPALINDDTEVLSVREPEELVLKARGWPLGEAHVVLELRADSADSCTVSIAEDAVSGPGRLAPKPVRQALIAPRNREALRRLGFLAEGRHRAARDADPAPGA
jgi:uncharacterized protein YndB with AHSA1/START domain